MLRNIQQRYLKSRMMGFRVTGSATPSMALGGEMVTGVSDTGQGNFTLELKEPYQRAPIVLTSSRALSTSTNGYYTNLETVSASQVEVFNRDINGTAQDSDDAVDVLSIGWDSPDTTAYNNLHLKSRWKASYIITGQINSTDGVVNYGKGDVTATRESTGIYTITFRRPLAIAPLVFCNAVTSSAYFTYIKSGSVSTTGFTIVCKDADGTVQDGIVNFLAYCTDKTSPYGGYQHNDVYSTQRAAHLLAFSIVNPAGTPAASINSSDVASVTDNGSGDYTINFAQTFRRAVACFATASANGFCTIFSQQASAVRIKIFDAAGSAADIGCNVVCLMSNDVDEK